MIFTLLMCSFFSSISQTHYHFFYGKVLDQISHHGIPDANITFDHSIKGTVAGNNGEFSFYMDTLPLLMIISHIGYETKKVLLDKTSYSLIIFLQQKTEQLPEIVVTAKSGYESFYKQHYFNILDYEIDSASVYILITDLRTLKSIMLCMNILGDTLARSDDLEHPRSLFKDCLGNIHLLTPDSSYQVYRDKRALKLLYPVSLKKFREVLMNCVLSTDDALFIKKAGQNNQTVSYIKVTRKGNQQAMLSTIQDSLKSKMLRRNARDNALLNQPTQPTGREDFVDWSYVHKILYRPVSTALYRFGDFICIFNTTDATIEYYDLTGTYAYKLKIMVSNMNEGSWTKEIFSDLSTSKVYTTFNNDGYLHVYRIDMNTGEVRNVFTLEHLFPEKLKFFKGYLFYLFHTPGSGNNRELYRQRL